MSKSIPEPQCCVLDLDGTLVDSLADIAAALNRCLDLLGLETYPVDRYRYLVGEGVPKLCQRAVGESHPHLVERLAELVRPYYRTRVVCETRPYPGVAELARRLRSRGVRLAVLSNKPHELTARVTRTFWPDDTFDVIQGYLDEQHRKPSPYYLQRICDTLGVSPGETWMIGDTPTDIATAQAARAIAVGAAWGFRPRVDLEAAGADLVVDHPDELR